MDDDAFDRALIAAGFAQAAELGWRHVTIPGAARAAGLPLARARARFPGRATLLLRFGRIADQSALAELTTDGTIRDRLFDLVMRRIDVLQAHRAGVVALLRAVLLACATRRSLRWLAQAVGVELRGLRGELKLRGLVAVWLWTLRAWERDDSTDLSPTMAALDQALSRAEQAARWLHRRPAPVDQSGDQSEPPSEPPPEPTPQPPQAGPPPENPIS
jgi:AcrR family transcriptional regulator